MPQLDSMAELFKLAFPINQRSYGTYQYYWAFSTRTTGPAEHFQIKWGQKYAVGLICPLITIGLVYLTKLSGGKIPTVPIGPAGLGTKADKPSEMPCKNRGKLIERGFPVLLLPCVEKTYVTKATRLCHTHALHSVQWG